MKNRISRIVLFIISATCILLVFFKFERGSIAQPIESVGTSSTLPNFTENTPKISTDSIEVNEISWDNVPNIFYAGQIDLLETTISSSTQVNSEKSEETANSVMTPLSTSSVPTAVSKPRKLPVVNGIVISSDSDKTAIIEGKFLREGEIFNGFTITAIRKNSVLLKCQDEEYVIYVQP